MAIDIADILYKIMVWGLPVLFAVTLHEVAHGWVANQCGDSTAAKQGRLSLNPLKHIDIFGTILMPLLLLLAHSPFLFGWAKPVPVVASRLNKPKQDMIWVAIAGPAANILMAIFWLILMKTAIPDFGDPTFTQALLMNMGKAGLIINVVLAVFNMLPIPPLDGSRVVMSLLPANLAAPYARLERFGLLIVMALLFSGLLGKIVTPLYVGLLQFLTITF